MHINTLVLKRAISFSSAVITVKYAKVSGTRMLATPRSPKNTPRKNDQTVAPLMIIRNSEIRAAAA